METLNLPLLGVRRAHPHPWCTDLGRPPQTPLPGSMPSCLQLVSGMVYWAFRGQGNPTPESWIDVELRDEKSSHLRSTPKTVWLLTEVIWSHYLPYYCCLAKLNTALRPPVSVASHALKSLRGSPGCEAEKLPTVRFCLVGINLFHLSVNKVFLIVMAFFEMHIKSDELDCIPDVTKCRERNGQISNKNLFKSVHYPQGPTIEANTRMSLR